MSQHLNEALAHLAELHHITATAPGRTKPNDVELSQYKELNPNNDPKLHHAIEQMASKDVVKTTARNREDALRDLDMHRENLQKNIHSLNSTDDILGIRQAFVHRTGKKLGMIVDDGHPLTAKTHHLAEKVWDATDAHMKATYPDTWKPGEVFKPAKPSAWVREDRMPTIVSRSPLPPKG